MPKIHLKYSRMSLDTPKYHQTALKCPDNHQITTSNDKLYHPFVVFDKNYISGLNILWTPYLERDPKKNKKGAL